MCFARAASCMVCLAVTGTFCRSGTPADLPEPAPRKVDFAADIEPLFRSRCLSCHGADEQESGLRLDVRQRALQGGDLGTIIIPENSAASRLVTVVTATDEEVGVMPPEGEGTPLTPEEISLIRAWIDQGAAWPEDRSTGVESDHWSFQPIQSPDPPTVTNQNWVRNPIDAFVAAQLEDAGIEPSVEADRATLIRRVHLDVLGLPPTRQSVERFLSDNSRKAYERMVQRVLQSDHYGERWGRHWLDLARYADSDGYEKDRPRPHAWRYREWVINALNSDLPFDQFTVEQVAGDLLPNATTSQRVASGFHRNTLHNTEGGTDQEEDRVKKTVDRTNTVSTIWLGLTMGCAQCHSHKYDPITQREYYALYAFFNQIDEREISAPLMDELAAYEKRVKAFDAEHAKFQAAITDYKKTKLPAAQRQWERTALSRQTSWELLKLTQLKSSKGAVLKQLSDKSVLVSGKNEKSDVYTVEATTPHSGITAIRLEVLPDSSLASNGPGRARNGNFVLAKLKVTARPRGAANGQSLPVVLLDARADYSQKGWDVANAINMSTKDGWAVGNQVGKRHVAVFRTKSPIEFEEGTRLTIELDQTYSGTDAHNMGHFRLTITTAKDGIDLDGLPADVAKSLSVPAAKRTGKQRQQIRRHYETIDSKLAKLQASAAEHAKKTPKKSGTMARVVADRSEPRPTRVHIRGDFLNQGELVSAATPFVLPAVDSSGDRLSRLDLARWLVDDQNPLMARVVVNRIWQRYFGRGIVPTVDDFGTQGDPPSHPLLLDWLAVEFRRSGWKLKHLHQLILNSATYRQSSAMRPDLADRDPQNVLLARQQRLRVEAEIVRDLAIAVAGLLEPKVGGPSVRPPQPEEYAQLTYANSAKWVESKGRDRYRRGLYTFFQRTSPYPMLMTFDAPDSNACTAQRSASNTPLQALTVWNDRVFWECAQHLGRRIVKESPPAKTDPTTDSKRAKYALQLCLARDPEPEELDWLVAFYQEQRDICTQMQEETKNLIGSAPVPAGVTRAELAGWVLVGRVLMNLDEFITRE